MLPAWINALRAPLGYPDGGSTYDLDTMLLGIRLHEHPGEDGDQIVAHANDVLCHELHERVHWVQHHGTSFGGLLSRLSFTREQRAHEQLLRLSAESRRNLFSDRNLRGLPILPLVCKPEQSRVSSVGDQLLLDSLRQDYQAQFNASARLLRFSGFPAGTDATNFVLALACTYEDLFDSEKDAMTFFRERFERCDACKWNGESLDTVDLLEGAAWLSELWFVHKPRRNQHLDVVSSVRRRFDSRFYQSYTRPLRAYLKATGTDLCDVVEHLPTLAVLTSRRLLLNRWVPRRSLLR